MLPIVSVTPSRTPSAGVAETAPSTSNTKVRTSATFDYPLFPFLFRFILSVLDGIYLERGAVGVSFTFRLGFAQGCLYASQSTCFTLTLLYFCSSNVVDIYLQSIACAQCGYPSAKMRSYEWGQKAKRRKTTGTGRMKYLKHVSRRFKNGFR